MVMTSAPTPHGGQAPDHDLRVETDGLGKREEFDEVDPSLPALYPRDEGLVLAQAASHLSLGKPGVLSKFGEHPDQRLMPRRI